MSKKQSVAPKRRVIPFAAEIDYEDVVERIVTQATYRLEEHLKTALNDAVERKVQAIVSGVAAKEIQAAVKKCLTEGWNRTDDYGAVKGTVTLKDRISELLNARDRYNSSQRWLDELVTKTAKDYLGDQFKKDIDAAREKLRAEIDGVTRAKLNEALRSALGLGGTS